MNDKSIIRRTLARALSIKRPHNGKGVAILTAWLIANLPEYLQDSAWLDPVGNLHVDARTDSTNRTLFVAHTDTVHRVDGSNKITKTRNLWSARNAPLGADDGAGVAMLMHLMHGGVDAYYVFTVGEEVGGIGAKYLTSKMPTLLAQFDRAIAFDRRGVDSVITHQGRGRCCSDAFGDGLAEALNLRHPDFMYSPDDTGVYTDTAEWIDIIPECTNISIGYYSEHSDKERLDIQHFERLAYAVLAVKWDLLPTARVPGTDDYDAAPAYGSWFKTTHNYDTHEATIADFYGALDYADSGDAEELLSMVAHSIHPDDPDFVLRRMDKSRLTDSVIDKAYDDIAASADLDGVLADIFDACCVTN